MKGYFMKVIFEFKLIFFHIPFIFNNGINNIENPLEVIGLKKTYCLTDNKITFKIKNNGNADIKICIYVEEYLKSTDEWREFTADISLYKGDTRERVAKVPMLVFKIPKGKARTFEWEPQKAVITFSREHMSLWGALDDNPNFKYSSYQEGKYRFEALYYYQDIERRPIRMVIGEFEVINCNIKNRKK